MSTTSWKEHFGNRVTGYDPIEAQGLSELGYALKHNQIPQEDYLQWARTVHELCSLDVKFFQSVSPTRELFERLKDVYPWGPECLPVAEWDEHVIIAGLEKPTDLPAELKPIFLLAPLEGLIYFWELYNSEGIPVSAQGEETSQEVGGIPEGLSISENSTATSLSFAGVSLGATETGHGASESAATVSPESSNETQTSIPVLSMDTPVNPEASAVSTASPLQPKVPPPTAPPIAIPELKAKPIDLNEELQLNINTDDSHPISAELEIKAQPRVVAIQSSQAPLDESLIQSALDEAQNIYEKRIYIEFNTEAKTAKARLWPQDFVATEAPSDHSLQEDSFLSIVYKTQKPYHGYIVKSALVDKFFSELNQGEIPENLTLVPLIQNGEVVGALAGWGPKTTYTLSTLRQMENIVQKLGSQLGWVAPDAA